MTYPCDLPANMGNTDIFRAIYAKLSDINPSTGIIEQKLDIIQDQLVDVNNNIEANTQAIKDISINVDIHSKDLQNITNAIDRQTEAIKDISINIEIDTSDLNDSVKLVAYNIETGLVETVDAIKNIKPGPVPHPHPCPPPYPPYPPKPRPCPEPVTPCDKIIPSYREGQRCKECEKQNQIIDRRCQEPKTLEELYETYYQCYYPTFDEFFQAQYGAREDYYYFRDGYYAQYDENYDYYV